MASKLTKDEMKTFYASEEIRRYRNEGCYSQEYVAKQLGLAQSTYQRIETGEINITLARLAQIAKILQQPIEVFLGKEKQPKPNFTNDDYLVQISRKELELLRKMIAYQGKRIEELEAKLQRRDLKIEALKKQMAQ